MSTAGVTGEPRVCAGPRSAAGQERARAGLPLPGPGRPRREVGEGAAGAG